MSKQNINHKGHGNMKILDQVQLRTENMVSMTADRPRQKEVSKVAVRKGGQATRTKRLQTVGRDIANAPASTAPPLNWIFTTR